MRLTRDKYNRSAILQSDITEGGKREVIDLKYASDYDFTEYGRDLIVETIRKDIDLASKHRIVLSNWQNSIAPLDTWHLVVNKETGEKRVMILDVGYSVLLNQREDSISMSRQNAEEALSLIRVGAKTEKKRNDMDKFV